MPLAHRRHLRERRVAHVLAPVGFLVRARNPIGREEDIVGVRRDELFLRYDRPALIPRRRLCVDRARVVAHDVKAAPRAAVARHDGDKGDALAALLLGYGVHACLERRELRHHHFDELCPALRLAHGIRRKTDVVDHIVEIAHLPARDDGNTERAEGVDLLGGHEGNRKDEIGLHGRRLFHRGHPRDRVRHALRVCRHV